MSRRTQQYLVIFNAKKLIYNLRLDLQFEMIKSSKTSTSNLQKSKDKIVSLLNNSIRSTSKQTSNLVRNSSNSSVTLEQKLVKSTSQLKTISQKNYKSTNKNNQTALNAVSMSKENEKENIKPTNLNVPTKSKVVDPKRKGNNVSDIRNNLIRGQNNSTIVKKQINSNNSLPKAQMSVNIKKRPLIQIKKSNEPIILIKQQDEINIKLLTPQQNKSQLQEQNSILKYIPPEVWAEHQKLSSNDFNFISTIQAHKYFKDVLALHLTLNALFTVRIIDKASVQKQQLKRQLIQSITIQLYLNKFHLPHLLTLYTVFQDANSVYLVMQPLLLSKEDQQNLTNCVSVHDKVYENLISLYCKQIAQTAHQLHKLKIILRDLNLEYLKVQLGVLKITLIDCAASLFKKFRRQSFLGDVQKIPQQLAYGKSYDYLYDSWNLGILLYILGTGIKPFSGSKAFRQIQQNNYLLPLNTSKELTQLIFKLIIQQSERLSVEQALQHQFFTFGLRQKNMVIKDLWAFWEYSN